MKYFWCIFLLLLCFCKEESSSIKELNKDSIPIYNRFDSTTSLINEEKVKYIRRTDSAASLSAVDDYRKDGRFIRHTSKGFFYIDSILNIDTVSRKEFYSLSKDKSIVKQKDVYKKDSILYLPKLGTNKYTTLVDIQINAVSCDDRIYIYYGEINLFNSYLVGYMDCDLYTYELMDRLEGEHLYSFVGYPVLSPLPKRSKSVSMGINGYDRSCLMQIDKIEEDTLKPLYYFNFLYWIPFGEKPDIRWSNENTFYIKVIPSKYLGMPEEKNEKLAFYISVEINE